MLGARVTVGMASKSNPSSDRYALRLYNVRSSVPRSLHICLCVVVKIVEVAVVTASLILRLLATSVSASLLDTPTPPEVVVGAVEVQICPRRLASLLK